MATNALKRKIVVFGGSGFVGSRVCEAAVLRGWEAVSVSRSGQPQWDTITSSTTAPEWSKNVNWVSANLFQPRTYREHLKDATTVVHSTGVLLEADYKGVLQGKESPISGLRKAFSPQTGQKTPNAATAPSEDPSSAERPDLTSGGLNLDEIDLSPADPTQMTYELMNRDTAILLARSAHELPKAPRFIYMSAAASFPLLPPRYLGTKRETEQVVASMYPSLRPVFIRAPFMCSPDRKFTMPLAAATSLGQGFNTATGGIFSGLLGAGAVKAMRVEEMGGAVVQSAEEDVVGPVEGEELRELAKRGWRQGML